MVRQKIAKKQRRIRAKKLLKLGLAVEITNLTEYDINILLGHLFNFKNINIIEQEKLKKDGEHFFEELSKYDEQMAAALTTVEKKARNHNLISLGALFEIAKLTEVNLAVLIGFLNSLHEQKEYYLSQCNIQGKLYFLKREDLKNGKKTV